MSLKVSRPVLETGFVGCIPYSYLGRIRVVTYIAKFNLGIDLRTPKNTVTDWSKGILFDPENLQYMVGQKNAFKDEQTRSNLIRGIILIDGEFNPDKFFPLLDVSFVRYNQYTVLPFPFKLIEKFIKLEKIGYNSKR